MKVDPTPPTMAPAEPGAAAKVTGVPLPSPLLNPLGLDYPLLGSFANPLWRIPAKPAPIEARIKKLESEEKALRASRWFAPGLTLIATLLSAAFLWFAGPLIFHLRESPLTDVRLYAGLIFLAGMIAASSLRIGNYNQLAAKQAEIDGLREEAKQAQAARPQAGTAESQSISTYFDNLLQGNQQYVLQYYGLVQVQADRSFQASLYAGAAGFLLIGLGLLVGFTDGKNAQVMSFLASGAGVLTEFISGVFFYLYNRTVRQMKGYHESLIAVQNLFLAFKLVSDTKDEAKKADMISQMLVYLVGRPGAHAVASKQSAKPAAAE